jgi:hypothetical protein
LLAIGPDTLIANKSSALSKQAVHDAKYSKVYSRSSVYCVKRSVQLHFIEDMLKTFDMVAGKGL